LLKYLHRVVCLGELLLGVMVLGEKLEEWKYLKELKRKLLLP
jgi:hypothetical protein